MAREESALIRYSYERLDRLNGYSSGMTSPAWHQLIWERTLLHEKAGHDPSPQRRREAALRLLFDIAEELRKRHKVAVPDAGDDRRLRAAPAAGRPPAAPGPRARRRARRGYQLLREGRGGRRRRRWCWQSPAGSLGGMAMGRVPPGAGTPPLVKDFAMRAAPAAPAASTIPSRRKAVLDIYRRPSAPDHQPAAARHGLPGRALRASYISGPDFVNGAGLDRLQEHWEYSYSVATEAALVEAVDVGRHRSRWRWPTASPPGSTG